MERKEKLKQLIEKYNNIKLENSEMKKNSSEEFYRVWINEFLKIFNWDVKNLNHVIQEKKIEKKSQKKLSKIGSTHIKPDYTLVNGKIKKAYLDAKDTSVNLFKDSKLSRESAYQIKCYGWSTNLPCSFITNFEQLVIYDCQNIPNLQDPIDVGGTFIRMEEYIDRFDELDKLLLRENVINGSLDRIYTSKKINGNKTLDNNFNIFLCEFRLELAKNLVKNNKKIEENEELLNYYTQVILDRIIFIRFCEGKELEKEGLLYEFLNSGKFWDNFKKSCYLEFYNHYDGAMFNIDLEFQKLELENIIFEKFIPQLYYPYPYKFDVIPTKILSNIYEDFLGTTLFLKNKIVCEDLKPDYIKSKGAIATPAYIVEEICKNTIDLNKYNNVNDILNLKIFDPCCGSGIFLIVAYEMICSKIKELLNIEENKKNVEKKYWIEYNNKIEITVPMKVKIISECLHSIDYDDVAIEVTKMSLALKIIDDYEKIIYPDVGVYGSKILSGIDKNIILGNTLFDLNKNKFNSHLVEDLKIIDFQKKETFYDVFNKKNGFDYIIGNPPYVETKHYKKSSSEMHSYLNQLYSCFHMKADLSILFLERCISLLNEKGKLGFIIQRRWFKADYGKKIRDFISKNNLLEKLYDINTSNIFLGRTTYVSIMVLSKSNNLNTEYSMIYGDPIEVKIAFEKNNYSKLLICNKYFMNKSWAPEAYEIEKIKEKKIALFGKIGDCKEIMIKDGIQALFKKIYHLKNYKIDGKYLIGKNGLDEQIKIEIDILKPVLYNKIFYPLKKIKPTAYSIFPYENDYKTPITYEKLKEEYPLAYSYLNEKKSYIQEKVEIFENSEKKPWYIFTREHNHSLFDCKKIIIPMTSLETNATYENKNGIYMDNSNMWFITLKKDSDILYKSLTLIINSTVFSVFAKAGANPQANGYFKFNKQFLSPVPFPKYKFTEENPIIQKLSVLYDEVVTYQEKYISSSLNKKHIMENIVENLWKEVDQLCYVLYELSFEEIDKIKKKGRISSIELIKNNCE